MNFPRTRSVLLLSAVLLTAIAAAVALRAHREPRLPYQAHFAQHRVSEWVPFGGFWQIQGDTIVNRSDAPGSKLITGSKNWSDEQIWADVELLAHDGDAGVITRVSDAEIGVDSYLGYFAGVRSQDGALVIGRADHSWLEKRPVPMHGGVQRLVWYRLHVVAVGCTIAAEATNLTNGLHTISVLQDSPQTCIHAGKFGLRSTDSSGAWRNVSVAEASAQDLAPLLHTASDVGPASYPEREDANSRMRMQAFPTMFPFAGARPTSTRNTEVDSERATQHSIANVATLRALPQISRLVTIRGVITFLSPTYLQDDTGGLEIEAADQRLLSIGDQIESTGRLEYRNGHLMFLAETLQLLRDRTPIFPLSVTPSEAMAGFHEGVLIDVSGEVISSHKTANGAKRLELAGDSQTFDAILQSDDFASPAHSWSVGSIIRVRGVCVMDTGAQSPPRFAVLVAQPSDVKELAGPSWRRGWRLSLIMVLALSAIAACFLTFLRFERAKNKAIVQERARLSHDMHDTLAQSFAGVGYHLQGLRKTVEEEGLLPEPLLEDLNIACRMVRETHREASASIAALHPQSHKEGDLLKQLEHSITSMLDRRRVTIEFQRSGRTRPLRPAVSDVLFRVGMEALANISRHSGATHVRLSLRYLSRSVVLEIVDNGVGFAPDRDSVGFGIATMRRRCHAVKAKLELESSPGAGCLVRITGKAAASRSVLERLLRDAA